MISLYIHIPFCQQKCKYCSFFVYPLVDEKFFDNYLEVLKKEILFWSNNLKDKQVKTIYFGGGTPAIIGADRLISLINFIGEQFDLAYLEEFNIEFNPNPFSQTLNIVQILNKKFGKKFFRLRFSFGIQTFDDDILRKTGRQYFYNNLIGFLRDLQKYKQANNIFNFDFISFGTKWKKYKYEFFEKFVNSLFADSFSIYTLELFPGSLWYDVPEINISDGQIYEEFSYLKSVVKRAGYKRYEISNFSLPGKESIHNLVYWTMENYIGIGLNASSFLNNINILSSNIFNLHDSYFKALRWTVIPAWKKYLLGNFVDLYRVVPLSIKDYKIERLFLALRTYRGVSNLSNYKDILVDNWENKIREFENQDLVKYKNDNLKLTDKGMDLYHQIIPELFKTI